MGKLALTSPPPIEKKVSWGSCPKDVRWFYTPSSATSNFPTTYRDEVLVGKLASETSPPPIEKRGSLGSWGVRWFCSLVARCAGTPSPRLPGLVAAGVRVPLGPTAAAAPPTVHTRVMGAP